MEYEDYPGRPGAGSPDASKRRAPCPPVKGQSAEARSVSTEPENASSGLDEEGARAGDNMVGHPIGVARDSKPVGTPTPTPTPTPIKPKITFEDDNKPDVPVSVASASTPVESPTQIGIALDLDDILKEQTIRAPAFLRSAAVRWGLVCVLALLLLYVFAQSMQVLRNIFVLPNALKWLALAGLVVLVGIVLYALTRAVVFVARLSSDAQISLQQLTDVMAFKKARPYRLAREQFLEPYLERMLHRPREEQARFEKMEGGAEVMLAVQSLLDPSRQIGHKVWVGEFMDKVQKPLVKMADARIMKYSNIVALKTAISPWPFVDMAAVGYNASLMLTDLACIFNQRFSRAATVRVFTDIFFSIYVAGEAQEAIEAVQGTLFRGETATVAAESGGVEQAGGLLSTVSEVVGPAFANIAKSFAAKAAEGAANWLLVRRMGMRAVNMLKPVA